VEGRRCEVRQGLLARNQTKPKPTSFISHPCRPCRVLSSSHPFTLRSNEVKEKKHAGLEVDVVLQTLAKINEKQVQSQEMGWNGKSQLSSTEKKRKI